MTFAQITRAQAQLRARTLEKEAGIAGAVLGAPFRAAGWGAGKVLKGAGKVALAPVKAMHGAAVRSQGRVLGNVMFAGGMAGTAAVAAHSVGRARKYDQGFDPRIQAASMRQR